MHLFALTYHALRASCPVRPGAPHPLLYALCILEAHNASLPLSSLAPCVSEAHTASLSLS